MIPCCSDKGNRTISILFCLLEKVYIFLKVLMKVYMSFGENNDIISMYPLGAFNYEAF